MAEALSLYHFSWDNREVSQVRSGSSSVPILDSSQEISPLARAALALSGRW